MRKWKTEELISDDTIEYISLVQAADILECSYISLIRKIRNKEETGFVYEFENGECRIPKESFVAYACGAVNLDRIKMMNSDFITVSQAAAVLCCSPQRIREQMKQGESIGFKYMQFGGKWKIFRKSFIDFFEKGSETVDDKC